MWHSVIAQAIGFIALALNVGSYQLKNSRQLVLCRAAGDTVYIFHYLLLASYSGCVTVAFCAANGLLCGFRGNRWADWKGWKWLISAMLIIACLITWRDAFDPLPCLCTLISVMTTIWVTWSGKGNVIRMGRLFVAGPTWLLYSALVGSIPGVLTEAIGMTSAAIALKRYGFRAQEPFDKQ